MCGTLARRKAFYHETQIKNALVFFPSIFRSIRYHVQESYRYKAEPFSLVAQERVPRNCLPLNFMRFCEHHIAPTIWDVRDRRTSEKLGVREMSFMRLKNAGTGMFITTVNQRTACNQVNTLVNLRSSKFRNLRIFPFSCKIFTT